MRRTNAIIFVAIELICNPDGHNRPIDPLHVVYLANAIRLHGLQHAITVIANKSGGYNVIAGLHRLEACRQLGHSEIECKVLDPETDEATLLEISISENASRKSETFSETLARIDHIMRVKKCSFEDAAKGANVHKSMTSKCKRVKDLGDAAKALIHRHPDKIGISIAYDVVRFATTEERQVEALEQVVAGTLSRDSLKAWLKEPDQPGTKRFQLSLTIEGIAIRLGIPNSTTWESLISGVATLKTMLLAEQKHDRLVSELPNHLK